MSIARGPFKFIGVLTVFTASVPVAGSPGVCNHEVPLVSGRSRFTHIAERCELMVTWQGTCRCVSGSLQS